MKIFLSSTILDLKDLRDALVTWLEADGHQVTASEKGTLPIEPDRHSYDQCLKAAAECDCLVAVIDKRFGGEYPEKGSNRSITEEEIATAITQGKKTLVFVRQSVWDAMATQESSIKSGDGADYWPVKNIVEDVRVFGVIDRLRKRSTNNWIFQFNAPTDLIETIRAQISSSPISIDWHRICNDLFDEQKQRLSSNPLHGIKPKNFDGVYVPLGLVKREAKERPQLDQGLDPSADRGSDLYQIETTTTPIEHDDFLRAVIDQQTGEHIVILGEPGAGKTTLLTRVWQSLLEQMNSEAPMIVAWVPLAALTNQGLAEYLKNVWLKQFCGDDEKSYWAAFEELAAAGQVWLLLDGADEMGGDGLTKIQAILQQPWERPWTKRLRAMITCRLNLWDGGSQNVLKEQFKIFRTLDFSYVNSDQVQQFIDKWFEGAETGRSLRSALDEVGKERIKDLAQNPLRLTLLCNIWQKSGGLPDTQAGFYEQFVNFVYGWSKVPDAKERKLELDRAMGQLAKYGINKPALRFRFTERELQAQMPNVEHRKLLKDLGWLNCVGEDQEGNEVYAFFHPTFQEYFAACSIDNWDYFLPKAHVDRPIPCKDEDVPTYRVFESEWRQPIVLWFGRGDVADDDKEKFIEKLTTFQDGVEGFYDLRAYFMAVICTGEFRNSNKAQDIVDKIVEQAFGYWDESQEWQSSDLLKPLAISIVSLAHRDCVIKSLMQLLENKIPNPVFDIKQVLEKIAIGRIDIIERILLLIEKKESELSWHLTDLLSEIAIKEDWIIDRLIKILKQEDFDMQPAYVNASVDIVLGRIAMDCEDAVEALLSTLDNCNRDYYRMRIRVLGRAKICKKDVIEKLFSILDKEDLDNDLCDSVRYALEDISDNEEWVIDRLIKLVDGNEGETRLYINAIEILGSIAVGNQNAINYLIRVITNEHGAIWSIFYTVLSVLKKIAIGNKFSIECLFELLKIKQMSGNFYFEIAKVLGIIAVKEEWFAEEIAKSIENNIFDHNNLYHAIHILGIVGLGSQKAIKILNILVIERDLETYIRFVIADSLLKIDPNKDLAISELESLLRPEVDQHIYFRTVYSLLMNNINNHLAVKALDQILDNMEDPAPLLSIQSLLEQFAINSEEIIQILLRFWGSGGLKFNINIVVSAILEKIAISNEATIEHALELLATRKFAGSALSVLGRIAVGHRSVIGAVVELLMQNELPWEFRRRLVMTLKMIATRETGEIVISSLKNYVAQEYLDSNLELWTACVDILLYYSQILSYQEFHRLWETNGLFLPPLTSHRNHHTP
jgi:Domain of unknown function (DUF4062)/NACHT domain